MMSTSGTQTGISIYNFPLQEPGFLGEMTDSWAGAEQYKMNQQYLLIKESKKRKCQKVWGASLQRLQLAKDEKQLNVKKNNALDQNISNMSLSLYWGF